MWYRGFEGLQLQMWRSLWKRRGQYVWYLCSSKCTYPLATDLYHAVTVGYPWGSEVWSDKIQ